MKSIIVFLIDGTKMVFEETEVFELGWKIDAGMYGVYHSSKHKIYDGGTPTRVTDLISIRVIKNIVINYK